MKVLIVAETESVQHTFSDFFESCGYDTICYRWLMKAMDNIEEIAPDVVAVSAVDYPRHWKTFVQFVKSAAFKKNPDIILIVSGDFTGEEADKARYLGVGSAVTDCVSGKNREELLSLVQKPEETKTPCAADNQPDTGRSLPEQPVKAAVSDAVFSFTLPGDHTETAGTVLQYAYPSLVFAPADKSVFKRIRFGQIIAVTSLSDNGTVTAPRAQIRGIKPDETLEFCLLK